jgi:hypothetical protein
MEITQQDRSARRRRAGITSALLAGNYAVWLVANFCFKEGGTNTAHGLFYFVVGNIFGITSTILLMGVYARMNINLAMVLATSGTFLLQQGTFWWVYHTRLTGLQVTGIAMVGIGTVLASLKIERGTPQGTVPQETTL